MSAYRETFRRHRLLYLLPVLLGAIALGAVSYKPASYVSTASLWVDNQPSSTSSLSVEPGVAQAQTPSAAEQSVLGELLATVRFDTAVLKGAGQKVSGAAGSSIVAGLVGGLTTTTPGPQVLQVTYKAASPELAHAMVQSIITELQSFSQQWAQQFAKAAVAYYETQVHSAAAAVAQSKAPAGSSQGSALASTLASATAQLSQAEAQADGRDNFSTAVVLDAPTFNAAPTSGIKSLVEKVGGGAVAGLVLSLLIIVFKTPSGEDRWDEEVSTPSLIATPSTVVAAALDATAPGSSAHPDGGRRSGLLARRMVMHHPFETQTASSTGTDGGRA